MCSHKHRGNVEVGSSKKRISDGLKTKQSRSRMQKGFTKVVRSKKPCVILKCLQGMAYSDSILIILRAIASVGSLWVPQVSPTAQRHTC